MANSRLVFINPARNNGHSKSLLLVSGLSVSIVLLVVAAIFVGVSQVRYALMFSHAYCRVPH